MKDIGIHIYVYLYYVNVEHIITDVCIEKLKVAKVKMKMNRIYTGKVEIECNSRKENENKNIKRYQRPLKGMSM